MTRTNGVALIAFGVLVLLVMILRAGARLAWLVLSALALLLRAALRFIFSPCA